MQKFSEIFTIDKKQAELDFVDVTPGSDIPLYLDPYALTTKDDDWSLYCHQLVVSYFTSVLESIKNSNRNRAIRLLSHLGEPKETHLGISEDGNGGRGIGIKEAGKIYEALAQSKAASSGLLEDLSDFALFIPRIGKDKISDITTNIIREALITYTQEQCKLYNIPMNKVSSGFCWSIDKQDWVQGYVELPIHNSLQLLLVPKYMVRYSVGVDHSKYRNMFILEFLCEEHLRADDSLVTTLRDKKGKITSKIAYKKTVNKHYPTDKEFITEFSLAHPEILDKYRDSLKDTASKVPDINGLHYQEALLAKKLKEELLAIRGGSNSANTYHDSCLSVISFLFFPNLIYPKKEREINQGRKRIDITYTNAKESGLFYRIALDQHLKANTIHVECKNYTKKLANPELDQLLARFDHNRGRFGMLFFRNSDDLPKLKLLCKDAAKQSLGVVLPIDDNFIVQCLEYVEKNERRKIDSELESLFQEIIS